MTKILVVDDQRVMRNMFKKILEPQGYHVDASEDGEIAYSTAMKTNYDLVLTDLIMPKLDGIELTAKLRKTTKYKGIPILIVSTHSGEDKKQQGKAAGATGWVVKPITSEQLLPKIEYLLNL